MSLDNIQLNNRVVADLYKNVLISLENNQIVTGASSTLKTLEFLGKNASRILLLVQEREQKYLAENDLTFLSKVLSAVNLTLADVAIVNCYENEAVHYYESLMEHLKPLKIIFFDVQSEQLGFPLQFAQNKPQNYNGQTYLSSVSLKTLQESVADKKLFWAALKQLFPN